jgi:hypothetical protein
MEHTGVAVTKGYNVNCAIIVHVDMNSPKFKEAGKAKVWKGLKVALLEAEKQNISSVALPPIGISESSFKIYYILYITEMLPFWDPRSQYANHLQLLHQGKGVLQA